ncbi:hypothetical protein NMB32_19460 [Stenotrophomonas sp. CD2]|nr:hypothetical protein NMB32_19460 [Stenotrophomonas sp. CD2]
MQLQGALVCLAGPRGRFPPALRRSAGAAPAAGRCAARNRPGRRSDRPVPRSFQWLPAAAAAHGLGLIAARRDDDAGSEQALARATQLQPLNTDYLGDLGYARLRAGQFEQAREPLAKALELSPGNAKATANLALWAVLRGDTATAERLAQQANLNEDTRRSIQQQAAQIRTRLQQRQATTATSATAPPPPRAVASSTAGNTRLAVEPRRETRDERDPQRLPPSMLERFSTSDHPNGNTP